MTKYVKVYSNTFGSFWAIRHNARQNMNLIQFTKCDKSGNSLLGNPPRMHTYILSEKDIKKILPARINKKYSVLEII